MTDSPAADELPMDTRIERLMEQERVRMIYRQMPTSISGTMVGVTLVASVMWPVIDKVLLAAWFLAMAINQGWRLKLYLDFRHRDIEGEAVQAYARRWFIGSAVSSAIWCAATILFFVPDSPIHQTILMISVFAITSVAVPLIASHAPSFHVFVIPVLTSMILRNAWEGDPLHTILAFIVTAVMLGVLSVGHRYLWFLNQSLRQRFENETLAARLADQNAELTRARLAAEQASRAKTRFFAAASHDLRQPLHAIGLFVALLAGRIRDPEMTGLVRNIDVSVAALESLFSELLDISKIDAGVVKPKPEDFDLPALFQRLQGDFEAEARKKGLQLRLRYPSPGIFVHSDPLLIERILRNLIGNAVRYTERGGILVALRLKPAGVAVEIWDTGIGIAPESQEAIFEEFYQLGNPERDHGKGLGLGLAIVRRITSLLELPLAVRSVPGRGTRFRLLLPAAAAPQAGRREPVPELAVDFSRRRVLLANEDQNVREGMASLLGNWGAEVSSCAGLADLPAAIDCLPRSPDLIISDFHLADGSSGGDLVFAVRRHFAAPIPAIVLTGTASPQRIEEAKAMDFHLQLKPVPPGKLRALINAKLAGDD